MLGQQTGTAAAASMVRSQLRAIVASIALKTFNNLLETVFDAVLKLLRSPANKLAAIAWMPTTFRSWRRVQLIDEIYLLKT
jgi:hypothetical protein